MTWTLHHTRQTTGKASTFSGAFGALLCQKLQCSLTVLDIRLVSRLVSSLRCIRMQSPGNFVGVIPHTSYLIFKQPGGV